MWESDKISRMTKKIIQILQVLGQVRIRDDIFDNNNMIQKIREV